MASSKNEKYENAAEGYNEATKQYTGNQGYKNAVAEANTTAGGTSAATYSAGKEKGNITSNEVFNNARSEANSQAYASTENAINNAERMQAVQNAQAKKYAKDQAQAAAAGAQSQATTAARSAGMNKAQAAMLGSQQNANAFQNAYSNAYSQQLGNAQGNQNTQLANYNSAFDSNANRRNSNINQQVGLDLSNQQFQQNMAQGSNQAALGAYGTQLSAGQQEGQNEYSRKWGNWGAGLGIASSLIPTSDERLKHYRECSKKVTVKSPNAIVKLKYIKKEN